MERDHFLPAQAAMEMGLIDEVLTTRKPTAASESVTEGQSS